MADLTPERLTPLITLYEGDCLDLLRTLEPGSVDTVITDAPYGIDLRGKSQGGRKGRSRSAADNSVIGDESMAVGIAVLDWCRDAALPTVAFASPKSPWPGDWSSRLVWDKGGAVGGGGDVKRSWKQTWELIQVARLKKLYGSRDSAVLRFPVLPSLSAIHPAAKPVPLLMYLISQTTALGDTVFDPFAGSGTTGVAAIMLGRKCIMVEKDPAYCDVIRRRIEEVSKQTW